MSSQRSRSKASGHRLPSYLDLIEDELRRRGGGGGSGTGSKHKQAKFGASRQTKQFGGASTALSRAAGNNAVVVKVLSYGAGAASARTVLAYQSKEERAVDQDGREVDDINAALRSWEREFGGRKGSKDVLRLTYELENGDHEDISRALRSLADEGFHHAGDIDRTYAFSVSEGVKGQSRLQLALVIAPERKNRADRNIGRRIAADIENVHAIDMRLDKAFRNAGVHPVSRYPAEFSSGPKGFTAALHAMQRSAAEVTVSTKTQITERHGKSGLYERGAVRREVTTGDHKQLTSEGRTVGALLQTRQPRDFMHLLLSGPANVDRQQFVLAGRDFLRQQFAGHRYAYAVHNRNDLDKHPHLHVIVGLRNSQGRSLNPNIRDFTEWRVRFADKARERGIAIDRQKRVERAAAPPVKRWEWEMFRRMGATAPSNVIEKVLTKVRDRPTAPRREEARTRFNGTRKSVRRMLEMLDGIASDKNAPSTIRELSQDLSVGLRHEHKRLEAAIREGRDPAREKGEDHMLRSGPITTSQASAGKDALARAAINVASKILNPNDRMMFEQAAQVIGKVVGLQLDARAAKQKDRRSEKEAGSSSLNTKVAAGRDNVDEKTRQVRTSANRIADISRIAQGNAEHAVEKDEREDRRHPKTADREIAKTIKLRPPQDKDRERGR